MKIKKLAELHNKVIHTTPVKESDLVLEDIWIKKYPYDVLQHVCSDCFSSPDLEVTP